MERVARAARAAGRMGLDTEFMREKTYRARLCLVQVAWGDEVALIDAHKGGDVKALADVVADPQVETIVHAGRQDLDILHDRFGTVPGHVFDVQVAAGFLGHGSSLPYGRLVAGVLGVSLVKGESYTDWCRRPLTAAQLSYAEADVRYLLPLADRLQRDLARRGRTEWFRAEMQPLESAESYGNDPREAWRRVPGRGTLSARQAAVLRELAAWREQTAAARDLPRGWLVKDPTLVEIARRRPASLRELKGIRGLNAREADRSADAILAAVAAGAQAPALEQRDEAWPREVVARARVLGGPADAIARARCDAAGIAVELVVTRGETEALLAEHFAGRLDESRHRVLRGWRRDLVGEHLLALADGAIAVRAIDSPPYVEEVRL